MVGLSRSPIIAEFSLQDAGSGEFGLTIIGFMVRKKMIFFGFRIGNFQNPLYIRLSIMINQQYSEVKYGT